MVPFSRKPFFPSPFFRGPFFCTFFSRDFSEDHFAEYLFPGNFYSDFFDATDFPGTLSGAFFPWEPIFRDIFPGDFFPGFWKFSGIFWKFETILSILTWKSGKKIHENKTFSMRKQKSLLLLLFLLLLLLLLFFGSKRLLRDSVTYWPLNPFFSRFPRPHHENMWFKSTIRFSRWISRKSISRWLRSRTINFESAQTYQRHFISISIYKYDWKSDSEDSRINALDESPQYTNIASRKMI